MSASACLRVVADAEVTGLPAGILGRLVAKYTTIYLEAKWLKPRSFEALDPYTYLLFDPGVGELDQEELRRLSDQLQGKLFGTGAAGKVALFLFEGSAQAVRQFATLDSDCMAGALKDPAILPPGGRLSQIVPNSLLPSEGVATGAKPDARTPAAASRTASMQAASGSVEGVQGVYFIPRQLFIGDVVSSTPAATRRPLSVINGVDHLPADSAAFDADCIVAAMRHLVEGAQATLFLPISFTNIVRTSEREAYREILSLLPIERRSQLSAIVYDTPRDPIFTAVKQIRTTLTEYFANIHLQTADPGFEIEKLQDQAVSCVTLVLPETDARARLLALRQFAVRGHYFRRKQIWCGVTNLRTRAELDACIEAKIALVTGPAICGVETIPTGGRRMSTEGLPPRTKWSVGPSACAPSAQKVT